MKENLPKVFKNTLKKQINNNEKVYITKTEHKDIKEYENNIKNKQHQQQINGENSPNAVEETLSKIINGKKHYTYKIPVEIELQDRTIATKIIGKTKNSILTTENEKIEIKEIKNITIIEK